MDSKIKKQVKSYIIQYLKNNVPNFTMSAKNGLFTCPCSARHENKEQSITANIFPPNTFNVHCFDPKCGRLGSIFDIAKMLEFSGQGVTEDDIIDYLIDTLNIQTDNKIEQQLVQYQEWGWSLVPVRAGGKEADIEKEWQKKVHKNLQEWKEWLKAGLNIGINGGEVSGTTIIDIDTKDVPEELKPYIDKTLMQTTPNGYHLFYQYEPELISGNLRTKAKLPVEIRNNATMTVIYPSITNGKQREFNDKEPIKMPDDLKAWLMQFNTPVAAKLEPIITGSIEDVFNEIKINGLEGNCNNTFMKFGGVLRKQLNVAQTEYVMTLINNLLLDKPMPIKDIRGMMKELTKYTTGDYTILKKQVLEYLIKHEEASARDLVECLRAERKDIQEVLAMLIGDALVYKSKTLYKAVRKPDWKTDFVQESQVLPYTIPYFHDYATFRNGDMICVGAGTGVGKSHISVNIINQYVKQGIKPHYISSEPGNRFATIALSLGLKEGDFYFCNHYEPQKLELEDNAITIVDWLLPDDFAGTANLYKIFAQQLDKHGGLLYIFSQLKEDGHFYARDMVKFFASFVVKYCYGKNGGIEDSENTLFKTEKIRESKTNQQYLTIPMHYDYSTKILDVRK